MLGSPVNRIKITGSWASRSLTYNPMLSLSQRFRSYLGYMTFQFITLAIDVHFRVTRARQWLYLLLGWRSANFEDQLEQTMRGFAKSNFGVEIGDAAFEG